MNELKNNLYYDFLSPYYHHGLVQRKFPLKWFLIILILALLKGFIIGFFVSKNIYLEKKCQVEIKPKVIIPKFDTVIVEISTFHATKRECGKFDKKCKNGYIISENKISCNRTAGISPDLKIKLNDTIEIIQPLEFSGKWIIKTETAKNIHNRIDILIPVNQIGGLWQNCKIIYKKKK